MENRYAYSNRRQMRMMIVSVIYECELLIKKIDAKEIFESDVFNDLFDYKKLGTKDKNGVYNEQLQIISVIEKNYELFKKLIISNTRDDWSWERMSPLVRSILLCASAELWKLDIGIVTNEYVEIAKDLIPDEKSYKFINIVIQKIGHQYEQIKQKKN